MEAGVRLAPPRAFPVGSPVSGQGRRYASWQRNSASEPPRGCVSSCILATERRRRFYAHRAPRTGCAVRPQVRARPDRRGAVRPRPTILTWAILTIRRPAGAGARALPRGRTTATGEERREVDIVGGRSAQGSRRRRRRHGCGSGGRDRSSRRGRLRRAGIGAGAASIFLARPSCALARLPPAARRVVDLACQPWWRGRPRPPVAPDGRFRPDFTGRRVIGAPRDRVNADDSSRLAPCPVLKRRAGSK